LNIEGTSTTIGFIKPDMDGGIAAGIWGWQPMLTRFSCRASGLLALPIHFEVFGSEPAFRLSSLPAGIYSSRTDQVYPKGLPTGHQQFCIEISSVHQMINWQEVFSL
jgi:hypothetical protein